MKEAQFLAQCSFKIGDIVKVKDVSKNIVPWEFEIADILSIYSCKTGKVNFVAKLDTEVIKDMPVGIEQLELIRCGIKNK